MKNKFLPLLFVLGAYGAYGQVGIGTTMPNPSSQLEVVASDRGVLIPRLPLTSTTDATTITNGNVNSLLVFNTATVADIRPGYYYWLDNRWNRIVVSSDLAPSQANVVYNPVTNQFTYIDNSGNIQNINFEQIVQANETITTLTDNGNGTFTYTNEAGVPVTINLAQGAQGPAGPQGPSGANGTSLTSSTGAPTGGSNGDTHVNTLTGDVYTNINGVWTVTGNIKGADGAQGAPGVNGTNGTSLTSGGTNPVDGTGTNGDTYINTLTGETFIYNGTTWVSTGNIKGADGTNGTNGTSLTSGGTNPVDGTGTNGDTYINTLTGDTFIYNGTTWVVTGNIKGADGAQGVPGTNGANGTSVTSGGTDPVDGTGNNGDTYINTVTGETFVYNGTTWVSTGNIKGADGVAGPAGAPGAAGADGRSLVSGGTDPVDGTGTNGDTYINTVTGETFVYNGTTWVSTGNIKGADGVAGPAGAPGAAGADGRSLVSGGTDPVDGTGNNGDTYINTVTGETFVYNGTTWVSTGNIKGADGVAGPAGAPGAAGADGRSLVSGGTDPVDGTGTNGDTYINTVTGETFVYNGTTWVSTGNIKGADGVAGPAGAPGTAGADGRSLVSGGTDPVDGTGNNGDTYINTVTGETFVYNGTTWVSTGNIKGADGVAGPAGAAGNGIATTVDNGDGTFTITYTDGSTFTTSDLTGPAGVAGAAGPAGAAGNGIATTVDNGDGTFTITYTDGSTFTTS
ncbi:beta strand repeat-containing protein, partial [Flavobacterium sp. PLA-1-15]|uniref:beta strand repeat-containing protein n=1 Tax=Flavobacterium sp. PLA-1-15 TaxID=3380533 RepID=UPI003B7FE2A9